MSPKVAVIMYTNYVSADGYDNGDSDENDYANEVETQ
jgi:hypothetical protein